LLCHTPCLFLTYDKVFVAFGIFLLELLEIEYFTHLPISLKPGVTNLFAIADHFVSYRWVSRLHNFLVILSNLLKIKIVHQQKQTTNENNKNPRNSIRLSAFDIASQRLEVGQGKFKTAGLAWMLCGPHVRHLRLKRSKITCVWWGNNVSSRRWL